MKILLAYDVSKRQTEVKDALKSRGFHDRWVKQNVRYFLPDTTVWHPNLNNPGEAITIFKDVIAILNKGQLPENVIKIDRLIAVEFSLTSEIEGKPYA